MTTSTVQRAYKFRFYPDEQQQELLLRTFGCVRVVYNKALEERTRAWRLEGKSINYADTDRMLTGWKKTEEYQFLYEVSSVPLQQALRHLQGSFQKFWSKQNKYPRFKSKKKSRRSATFTKSALRWNEHKRELKLAKTTAPLDIRWSRELPEGATPSSVTVSQDSSRRWYVSLLVEEQITHLEPSNTAIGIDLGVTDLAVLSTGEKIPAPRYSRTDHARLRRAQQALARTQLGSRNRQKARLRVAKIHAAITDRRRDHLYKLSTKLIRENQTIILEDLAVAAMSASGGRHKAGLNRSLADASLAELRSLLEYKAQWYGREVIAVSRWLPSTQLCSACSAQTGPKGRSGLGVRTWNCTSCGTTHDRDLNAALNIKAAGLAASVCGDGRSLR